MEQFELIEQLVGTLPLWTWKTLVVGLWIVGGIAWWLLLSTMMSVVDALSRRSFRSFRNACYVYALALAISLPALGRYTDWHLYFGGGYFVALWLVAVLVEAFSTLGKRIQLGHGVALGFHPASFPVDRVNDTSQ